MISPSLITQEGQLIIWEFKVTNPGNVPNTNVVVTLTIPSDFIYVNAGQPVVSKGSVTGDEWVIVSGANTLLPGEEATYIGTFILNEATEGPTHTYEFIADVTATKDTITTNNELTSTVAYQAFAGFESPLIGSGNAIFGPVMIDVSKAITTNCTLGVNKYVYTADSVVNGVLISWSESTGIGYFKYIDPTLPITGTWTPKCIVNGYDVDTSSLKTFTIYASISNKNIFDHKISSVKFDDLSPEDIAVLELQYPDIELADYCWRLIKNSNLETTSGDIIDCNEGQDVKFMQFCSAEACVTEVTECPTCEQNQLPGDVAELVADIAEYEPEIGDTIMVQHPNAVSYYEYQLLGWFRSSCDCVWKISQQEGNQLTLGDDNAPFLAEAANKMTKISATDTTSGYILSKIISGTNITITQNNIGGNESMSISSNDTKNVENNTAGVGSPNILLTGEKGKIFTNTGATALNYHTLPSAAVGLSYNFIVTDADGIVVTANTDDIITIGASSSTAAGTATSTTLGSTLTLVAIDTTTWHALHHTGTWTLA